MFAMAESTPAIESRLRSESCDVVSVSSTVGSAEDAGQTIVLARANQADWIVVDGYQFDADYQRALKSEGLKVLFLDDYGHARHYSADFVLNHNVCATEALYADREPHTQFLLGPRYCLLRREFAAWRNWKRGVASTVQRLLVVMGGSDPENLTARVIEAVSAAKLEGSESLKVMVVVGGSNPHLTTLQNSAARSGLKIEVRRDVFDMAELMTSADVAVSAAGSTCWELCLLALPSLLIDVAANQTALAVDLDRRGCAIHLGDHTVSAEKIAQQLQRLLRSHELRRSLSQRSRELVDGDGASRVVSALREYGSRDSEGLHLRRARADDIRILWEWANDSEVRAASFSSAPIPWETHVAWFTEKMAPARSLIFIAEDEERCALRADPF